MSATPHLVAGVSTVELVTEAEKPPWRALVASVLDAGLVLSSEPGEDRPSLGRGQQVQVIVTNGDRAHEARGAVAGSSSAGVAIELKGGWQIVERRGFPRVVACVPLRYRRLDPKTAKQVATAIRSRVTERPANRPSDMPFERGEMATLNARLQKMERAIELLTDLVLWAGTGRSPLSEREVVLSASGLSLDVEDEPLEQGAAVELEFLLPLRDPIRVRALGTVVRRSQEGAPGGRVAIKFDCIDESDRDEIARYVFQIQRRRQKTTLI